MRREPRLLIIVARDEPGIYDGLNRTYCTPEAVEVIVDRRVAERRQRRFPHMPERRRARLSAEEALDLYPYRWSGHA